MFIFKKKEKVQREELSGYTKIIEDIYINQVEQKVIINKNTYDFSQLLDVKLKEDYFENNIISGMKINNNFGTAIGTSNKLVNQLDIEIKTSDIINPFICVKVLKLGIRTGFSKSSKKYKESYTKAQMCLSILELIIKEKNGKMK